MFMYCKNISYYYMQLEDDVTAESRYFARMKFFISNINLQKSKWFSLEFSSLGFLGKLLRNNDLQDFANFLLMFYWEQPGDLLFGYMKKIKTQFRDILYKPTIHEHKCIVNILFTSPRNPFIRIIKCSWKILIIWIYLFMVMEYL
jgi:alpha-1,3-mannosylglycoprotein beta-1,4-N-acetylglucosaminyltransferase C